MKIIYCGDIVGRAGRDVVLKNISTLREKYCPDTIVVNAENAAHGFGVTPGICRDLFAAGVDALTTGNHVYDQREIIPFLDDCKKIIRPLNFPDFNVGKGFCEVELTNGKKLLVVQVMGRAFMDAVNCPVQAMENLLKTYILGANISAILVDIHAEATAEKLAFAHFFDGKVSVIAGTHTHVPTADARVFPKGTAYITDVGMCGDYNSVLGFEPEASIRRLCKKFPSERLIPAKGAGTLYAVFVQTDDKTGLATHIEQIMMK